MLRNRNITQLGSVCSMFLIFALLFSSEELAAECTDTQTTKQAIECLERKIDNLAPNLYCKKTSWGEESACAHWPVAIPPECEEGYTYVGIAAESHSDEGCGASIKNKQKIKGMCCKITQ